jgi:hypothetical protein
MAIISNIIDALRKFGDATQKTALQRQDEQLHGKRVIDRRRYVARSELGHSSTFVATNRGGVRVIYTTRLTRAAVVLLVIYAKCARESIPAHVLRKIAEEMGHATS